MGAKAEEFLAILIEHIEKLYTLEIMYAVKN